MSELRIPERSLVVLVGASGSGKSTFAAEHFDGFEVLSSDTFRGMVSNDVENQASTPAAFEALTFVAGKRLEAGLLTVIDATSVQPAARKHLVELARSHDLLPVAIVLDLPVEVCLERNATRADRAIPDGIIKRQTDQLRRGMRGLKREGFRTVHVLRSVDEVAEATIVRTPLLTDRGHDHGPFDVIGDVHGCFAELEQLLTKLGYVIQRDGDGRAVDAAHPDGRRVIFLGDLVDRGPDSVGVLRLAMGMAKAGNALAVPGNHEEKLQRALSGRKVTFSQGLDGKLVVAHAGLKESYQGRASGRVRAFALYGETTGETDEFGLPVRTPWANDYLGSATVLYGHVPTPEVEWINNTTCLDTGCVFGGKLTAMRYPERELVEVPAARVYYEPVKPLFPEESQEADHEPHIMHLDDVQGKVIIFTAHQGKVTITAEQSAGALETMSRYAIDPRALVYLPPTMSPPATSREPGYLEYPTEAFTYFRKMGVTTSSAKKNTWGRAVSCL